MLGLDADAALLGIVATLVSAIVAAMGLIWRAFVAGRLHTDTEVKALETRYNAELERLRASEEFYRRLALQAVLAGEKAMGITP